ncbi:MAG TPA: hypothetical protein EYP09_01855, partial [Anaerolineae bacterium]|nr:hypothetical protein [Anaerolineae bacterium]
MRGPTPGRRTRGRCRRKICSASEAMPGRTISGPRRMARFFRMPQMAFIDLTTRNIMVEEIDPALPEQFLGGRGLGAALLSRHLANPAVPLWPQ